MILDLTPQPWADDAECARHPNPDLWFAENERGHQQYVNPATVEALAICRGCPVVALCLEYALTLSDWDAQGIWAATTRQQRRNLRRRISRRQVPVA